MNSRCQVVLTDMQSEPAGDYRFIMNYQDLVTKFTNLRPLKSKSAEEVGYQLIDIFCMFGAPFILQSDKGRVMSANYSSISHNRYLPRCKLCPFDIYDHSFNTAVAT
jgi:hypothetical protein